MEDASSEDGSWTDIRLEELLRVLEEHREAGEKKRQKFRTKLDLLKERQEVLQERRVERLRDEGIVIDLDIVKRRAREARYAMLREKKADKDGSDVAEDENGSGDEWEEYESDLDLGRQSRGTRSLVHMDSTASLHRQSRLGRIREEIEGMSHARRKPDIRSNVHPALQRMETKISVVKSFLVPGRAEEVDDRTDGRPRRSNGLRNVTTVVRAVNRLKSPCMTPRTWRGGAGSPPKPQQMSRESKARHLFSYSGFNKK